MIRLHYLAETTSFMNPAVQISPATKKLELFT